MPATKPTNRQDGALNPLRLVRRRKLSASRRGRHDLESALRQKPRQAHKGQLRASEGRSLGNGQDPRAGGHAGIMSGVPGFDDDIWEAVPEDPGPPPAHLRAFVEGLAAAEEALDLGCGDGRLTATLQARRLTGADVSQVALERARKRLPDAELVGIEPDAPLPFPDSGFDLVLCAETIEHVRDTQFFFSEIRRVLRPGGRLALTTPAGSRWRVLLFGLEHPFSPHLRTFTRHSLRGVLDAMGFHVVELDNSHRTLMCVAVR